MILLKLEFIGAAHEVTGSCHLLTACGLRILVDCGMEQGKDIYINQELPVNPSEIDIVLVTHAHIDHSGLLPLLFKNGFRGRIYATRATTQLCEILLKDSADIQRSDAEWRNRKAKRSGSDLTKPLFDESDVENVLKLFIKCRYGEPVSLSDNITIVFHHTGHLLGSAFIEVSILEESTSRKIVFSGDIGNGDNILIKKCEPLPDTDYLVIESTYGNKTKGRASDYTDDLRSIIEKTFARGGNVIFPASSVGRTQEILYHIRKIKLADNGQKLGNFKVFVDTPLSVEATNIFSKNVIECFNDNDVELIKKGINPIKFEGLVTSVTQHDSIAINNYKKPCIIIAASGMCEGGRIRHHLKHNLWRPECSIVFAGYQMSGTLGDKLVNGEPEVDLFGETISVKASIESLPGTHTHADRDQLISWIKTSPSKLCKVFVVHGEDKVTESFASHVTELTGTSAYAPFSGDEFDLISGNQTKKGTIIKIDRNANQERHQFEKLLAITNRLISIVYKYENSAVSDMKRISASLQAFCERWDKKQ